MKFIFWEFQEKILPLFRFPSQNKIHVMKEKQKKNLIKCQKHECDSVCFYNFARDVFLLRSKSFIEILKFKVCAFIISATALSHLNCIFLYLLNLCVNKIKGRNVFWSSLSIYLRWILKFMWNSCQDIDKLFLNLWLIRSLFADTFIW